MIGCVRRFIHAGCNLLLEELDNIVHDAGRDGYVLVDPGCVLNDWDLDQLKIIILKKSTLSFCPGYGLLVELQNMLSKLELYLLRLSALRCSCVRWKPGINRGGDMGRGGGERSESLGQHSMI